MKDHVTLKIGTII